MPPFGTGEAVIVLVILTAVLAAVYVRRLFPKAATATAGQGGAKKGFGLGDWALIAGVTTLGVAAVLLGVTK